jgi:hypothetical protein
MTNTHVCLVHGAPGCGKTHGLLDAIEDHARNDDIGIFDMYLANFTNNGREATAHDLVERGIFDLTQYDDINEADLRGRCRTLHSIALGCCPEVEEPKNQVITMDENPEFYKEFCREHGLAFEPEETNPLDLICNGKQTTPRGNKLFALNQWLHARYLPSADQLSNIRKAPVDIELASSRVRALLQAWDDYKRERMSRRFEHHDYVDICLENGYVPDIRLLGIDEFQDLSPVEYGLFKQWRDSEDIDWIYIAGDVNQCVPEGTLIKTPDGPVPIEEITEGDAVVSAYTDGESESFAVTATHERPANEPIVSLVTESGATVSCTRNHELFAVLPNQRESNGDVGDRHFVYVMKSASGEYRVGITQMPHKRFTMEPGAAAMMMVGAFESAEDALLAEKQIASEYGIPQMPFKNRGDLFQSALNELSDGLDTQDAFYDLCEDKDLDPDRFHLVAQSDDTATSEYQGAGERVRVSLKLGEVRERKTGSDYVYHLARVVTANDDAIEQLRATPLNESDERADGPVRFRFQSSDYMNVRTAAQEAVDALHKAGIEAELCEEATYDSLDESGGRHVPLSIVPASQVTEGMYVPVVSDGSVEYEQVVDRTEQEESTTVYDLTVPPTHNYVVGADRGVAVHNSIYSFRCASPYYLARTDVDERRFLTDSYRCPEAVSGVARGILEAEESITRNVFRTASRSNGHTPEGTAQMRTISNDESMVQTVRSALEAHDNPDGNEKATVYLLTRTNYQLGVLSTTLQRHGVPFDAIGEKMDPWPEKVVDCLIALRALRRGTAAPRESVETLINIATNSDLREERFREAEIDREFRVDLESDPVSFPEQIKAAFPGRPARTIVDVLDLTDYQQDMLRGALESNAAPHPERIQVGTIHEAKGLQAPCVFLFTETTQNILDRYRNGVTRAEEHRIYYVGATRASESLYVIDGFFQGPRIPIFDDGLPGHTTDSTTAKEAAD